MSVHADVERVVAVDWSGDRSAAGQRRKIWAGVWTASPAGRVDGGRVTLEGGRTRDEFCDWLIALAREKGLSAYVGEGKNRWAAAHVSDVARLYRLALEKHEVGARYHAVAEEGVPLKAIAESIGCGLKIPVVSLSAEEAAAHFGWLTLFASSDLAASSEKTRKKLGWNPTGPGLISDLNQAKF